jgi:predicted Zn-dependent protease
VYQQLKAWTRRRGAIAAIISCLATAPAAAYAVRALNFKPGFNLFKPEQDVQLGRQNAMQINRQVLLLHDSMVDGYITRLGRRLASFAPDDLKIYPWIFHVVNTSEINAFALPGGFVYVNRGTIQVAQDEAQLAGVMAHEIGHVVMRHGTHQASEKALAQMPLSLLGNILGGPSLSGLLARIGVGFGLNSLFLKNSRDIEAQADAVGTDILYRAGYDPHAMAQFFRILQEKYPQQTIQFFSDHPNPGNRINNVDKEIPLLGPPKHWIENSPQFEAVKKKLASLPPPPAPKRPAANSRTEVPSQPVTSGSATIPRVARIGSYSALTANFSGRFVPEN